MIFTHFNPRAPYGARLAAAFDIPATIGISIHAPHTGRDYRAPITVEESGISIHAPHTGRDVCTHANSRGFPISIHAPHTGRDLIR